VDPTTVGAAIAAITRRRKDIIYEGWERKREREKTRDKDNNWMEATAKSLPYVCLCRCDG